MKKIVGIILLVVVQMTVTQATKFTEPYKHDYRNISTTTYSTIVIRKSRQTNSNDSLNEGTDKLRNQISNFTDSFRKEISNRPKSNSKIVNLESEIRKVKEELELLKNAPTVDSSSKTKFSSLESAIETLQKLFDDYKKLSSGQMDSLETIIDSLTASVSEYRRELEKIKELIDEKDRIEKERGVPAEIAQDIRDGNAWLANKKFLKLRGDFRTHAAHVIRATNINQGNSFERVIDFVRPLHEESEIAMTFYEALWEEMESVHFNDIFQFFNLIRSVKFTHVDNTWDGVPENLKSAAKKYLEKVQSTARDIASRKLEDAMITDSYRSVVDLCNFISTEDRLFFRDIIKQAISKVINTIDAYKLYTFMTEHHLYISQRIFGYSAIFNELKNRNSLNNPAVVFLAYGIKDLMGMENYKYTPPEVSTAAEEIKNALPKSVRNLAFSTRVCIKNRDRQERLFASDYQSYDESRRNVYTWIPGTRVDRDQWVVFPEGNYFLVKSYYIREYLYAADDNHKFDNSRRSVLTWIPGDRVVQGRWSIEPSGDDVYIKNYVHNEYLYASHYSQSTQEHVAFTWGSGSKPPYSLWTIEDCP